MARRRILPSRPINTSVDRAGEYLLTAYNDPSSVTVHRINKDGALGDQVAQPNKLDTGIYAHQIRATPNNEDVILVTRGNNAEGGKPEDPGAIKTFAFKNGILTGLASVAPGNGLGFGPRHLDFHPTQPWVFVSIERQSQLYVYRLDPKTGLSRDPLFVKTTLPDPKSPIRQTAGAIHVHPNGRFVYLTNRSSEMVDFQGQKVAAGGLNSVAVFAIDPSTGEPTLIQNADGHAIELRTFGIDRAAACWSRPAPPRRLRARVITSARLRPGSASSASATTASSPSCANTMSMPPPRSSSSGAAWSRSHRVRARVGSITVRQCAGSQELPSHGEFDVEA